jgi:molybdenum cofactor synthesis domain-containing protein
VPTAAVLVVGDEILSGKFTDENGPYLIRRLRELGCDLRRLVVVPDTLDAIAEEVARAAGFDHVVTTGGVGPTHDDLTFEGVARGLGRPLVLADELVALLARSGLPPTEANLRMCRVPEGYRLEFGRSSFPVVRAGNTWIFPGVPSLFRKKFEDVANAFRGAPILTARRATSRRETDLAEALAQVAARFPAVAIGSYPRWGDGERMREEELVLTLESRDADALDQAAEALDRLL